MTLSPFPFEGMRSRLGSHTYSVAMGGLELRSLTALLFSPFSVVCLEPAAEQSQPSSVISVSIPVKAAMPLERGQAGTVLAVWQAA